MRSSTASRPVSYTHLDVYKRQLQFSLNVPAVAVLDRVGPSRLAARLAQAGAALTLPDGDAPGLAIGLGGAGIKLSDLVMLYSCLLYTSRCV